MLSLVATGPLEFDNVRVAQQEKPPKPGPLELLIRVEAAAVNPVDWKMVKYNMLIENYPATLGCDLAGVVQEVGSEVTRFKKGDRVAAMTIPTQKGHHAFAEFSLVHNFGAVHIADDLSFEAAATLPVGLLTAAHSLFHSLQLQPLGSAPSDTFVLIWGASGSVGTYAVQLASLAGLKVIATASPRNFDLLKTLGAAHVFDYRDPNVVNLIKETAQGNLHYAFDATSPEAALLCSQALAVDGPARLHTIVELPKGLPPHITATLGLLEFAHKVPEDIKFLTEFTAQVEPYLASGKIRPNKVELLQGGLTAIPDAFQRMYDNKVSAVKLVANIADTKSQL